MAARGTTLLAGGVVVGAALAWAINATTSGNPNILGNTSTQVTLLAPGGSACELSKATIVPGNKDKWVTWKVKNNCPQAQTVRVGNFRRSEQTTKTNCDDPTDGGATSPFQQDDQPRRTVAVDPGAEEDIKLKIKSRGDLGNDVVTYYFSICLGQTIADPRLVIER